MRASLASARRWVELLKTGSLHKFGLQEYPMGVYASLRYTCGGVYRQHRKTGELKY